MQEIPREIIPGRHSFQLVPNIQGGVDREATEFEYYCGRSYQRYYQECEYPFPNDNQRLQAEELADPLWRITLTSIKGLNLPDNRLLNEGPLVCIDLEKSPQDVLDLGTGSGQWAMDYGTNVLYGSIFY